MGRLFLDNWDYCGLFFWYDDIIEVNKQIEKARAK